MEDEKAGLTTRLEKLKQEVKDSTVAAGQAENDIKDAEGLIKKIRRAAASGAKQS